METGVTRDSSCVEVGVTVSVDLLLVYQSDVWGMGVQGGGPKVSVGLSRRRDGVQSDRSVEKGCVRVTGLVGSFFLHEEGSTVVLR